MKFTFLGFLWVFTMAEGLDWGIGELGIYDCFGPLFEVIPLCAILAFHWAADCVLTAKENGVKDLWI